MAEMIPSHLPDHATQGEKAVFAALQNLPDNIIVYYEPVIMRRYPDFIIIDPESGVLVIEVKGWRVDWIVSASSEEIVIRQAGREYTDQHPLRQARNYQTLLMLRCQSHPYSSVLLNDNQTRPRLGFRFGHLTILTGILRSDLKEKQLDHLFPAEATICSDELPELNAANPASLRARLSDAYHPNIPKRILSTGQVNLVRAIIHPVELPRKSAVPATTQFSWKDLRVLDLEQERTARDMRSGHRVLYGVAGSGKTVILTARAKLIAEDRLRRILVLCYNKALAKHLRQALAEYPNITVKSFGQWAFSQGASKTDDAEEFGLGLLHILRQGKGQSGHFDAVLIDEGQDFVGSWFKCCVEALRDQTYGDLVIAYDLSQNLYIRPVVTWSHHGVKVVGGAGGSKTTRLPVNYRNTFQIMTAAASFGQAATSDNEDIPSVVEIDITKCKRQGPWPGLSFYNGKTAQIHACKKFVQELLGEGIALSNGAMKAQADEIRVLYRRNLNGLVEEVKGVFKEAGLENIGITTVHASKGLQFKVVILICAEQFSYILPNRNNAAERALFYVALTRAEELLIVLSAYDTPFLKELSRNIDAGQNEVAA